VVAEVALVDKACLGGDACCGHALGKELTCFLDPHMKLIFMRSEAECLPEGAHQMVAA
jgi:hypothetical protein